MTPLFVTFEGLDGSGKSTQLARAAATLTRAGVPHVVTHEPGGTKFGARVRDLFLDSSAPADPIIEALLLFASRRQNLIERIEPGLASGRHVLCDRFTDSTLAYQGAGRRLAESTLRDLARIAIGDRVPDLTLWFDVEPSQAASRRGCDGDRLDRETLAFRARVRQGYRDLERGNPDRIVRIDASGSIEEVERAVTAALSARGVLPR